jgi:hypothetical protein
MADQQLVGHGKRTEVYLPLRAKRAARDESQSNRRYPRRFILFGPRMVTLEEHLLSQARTHHSMQKRINVLLGTISRYKAIVTRRENSLGKAHRYIQDLKANGAMHPRNSPPPNLAVDQ